MEVCVDNVRLALDADAGGAIRIQLCSAMREGGLTPSLGMFRIIKRAVAIPVYVLIRPNADNSFSYSDFEINAMKRDITTFKQYGADGFVFGALRPNKTVDVVACKTLLDTAAPLPVTFNRAFDFLSEPYDGLEVITRLGFKRILTSGQADTADKGCNLIKKLVLLSRNRIIIMPAAGITENNLKKILEDTKAIEVHFFPKQTSSKQMLKMAAVLQQYRIHEAKLMQSCRFGGIRIDANRYFNNFNCL